MFATNFMGFVFYNDFCAFAKSFRLSLLYNDNFFVTLFSPDIS